MQKFEKKGIIQIILRLNKNREISKYGLLKKLNLSKQTFQNGIECLANLNIIISKENVGPRNKTNLSLSPLGEKIASKLIEIRYELKITD